MSERTRLVVGASVAVVAILAFVFLVAGPAVKARWERDVARMRAAEPKCYQCEPCEGLECGELTVAAPCVEVLCD